MGRYEGYVTNDLSRGSPVPSLLDEPTVARALLPLSGLRTGIGAVTSVTNEDIIGEASMMVDDKEHLSVHREFTTGELREFARRWWWKGKKILVMMSDGCRATFPPNARQPFARA